MARWSSNCRGYVKVNRRFGSHLSHMIIMKSMQHCIILHITKCVRHRFNWVTMLCYCLSKIKGFCYQKRSLPPPFTFICVCPPKHNFPDKPDWLIATNQRHNCTIEARRHIAQFLVCIKQMRQRDTLNCTTFPEAILAKPGARFRHSVTTRQPASARTFQI